MNKVILVLGTALLVVLAGILVSLLRAEYREKVIDTNKKVVLHGGKNVNPNAAANGDGIIGENLSMEYTVVNGGKRQARILILCLTEQKSRIVYQGRFVNRQITVGRMEKRRGHPREGMLYVKDSKVSHMHCRIYREQDHYLVEDCRSTNHTWVNGKPVTAAVPLKDGDHLKLAKKTYEVRFLWSIHK